MPDTLGFELPAMARGAPGCSSSHRVVCPAFGVLPGEVRPSVPPPTVRKSHARLSAPVPQRDTLGVVEVAVAVLLDRIGEAGSTLLNVADPKTTVAGPPDSSTTIWNAEVILSAPVKYQSWCLESPAGSDGVYREYGDMRSILGRAP